jgi:cellobiose phosphorylase
VFNHAASWLVLAECLMGRGNQAFEYYKKMLPFTKNQHEFQAEPYVYSQYVTSDEHSMPGKASHSWQTGTAAWMYRISFDYIIGVRPTYDGLLIDPAIPSDWKSLKVERLFRGTRYIIEMENPDGVEHSVKEIWVDGKTIKGNVLPVSKENVCRVKVLMGKKVPKN